MTWTGVFYQTLMQLLIGSANRRTWQLALSTAADNVTSPMYVNDIKLLSRNTDVFSLLIEACSHRQCLHLLLLVNREV